MDYDTIKYIVTLVFNFSIFYAFFRRMRIYRQEYDNSIAAFKELELFKEEMHKKYDTLDSRSDRWRESSIKYVIDIDNKYKDIDNKIKELEVHIFNMVNSTLYPKKKSKK